MSRVTQPDRLESLAIEFHIKVRAAFLHLAQLEPTRFLVVDASQSTQEISELIFAKVKSRLTP
jgi:dTMP kinase